ncbi:MAG: hypothetical protein HXS47_09360 [Theionarchaea archaeon]|nr:hypothetical protein [Theionarchaea archaeon]
MEDKELLIKMESHIQANRKNLPFPRLLAEGICNTERPLAEKETILKELFGLSLEEGQYRLNEIAVS